MESKKKIKRKKQEKLKQKKTSHRDITAFRSILVNWKSWLCIFIAVYIVSYPNVLLGIATFIALTFMAYGVHAGSHYYRNVFTILHHYHHENSNWFSHFSQMLMELSFPVVFYIYYLFYSVLYVDPWIVLFFTLVYTTVHNVNYGYFHVNDVHRLHHADILTNIGPDLCDILFGTKHPQNTTVENTDHQLPNVAIFAVIVLLVKYIYFLNERTQRWMYLFMQFFLITSLITIGFFSIYLAIYYHKKCHNLLNERMWLTVADYIR